MFFYTLLGLVLMLTVSASTNQESGSLADRIMYKDEVCELIRDVTGERMLDEGGDKMPSTPGDDYFKCRDILDNMKRQYISQHFPGLIYYPTEFPITLSNGAVIVLSTPPEIPSSTRLPSFMPAEGVCMMQKKCDEFFEKINETDKDFSDDSYYKEKYFHCVDVLDELKLKYIRDNNIEIKKLSEVGKLSIICNGKINSVPLPGSLQDNLRSDSMNKANSNINDLHENQEPLPVSYKNGMSDIKYDMKSEASTDKNKLSSDLYSSDDKSILNVSLKKLKEAVTNPKSNVLVIEEKAESSEDYDVHADPHQVQDVIYSDVVADKKVGLITPSNLSPNDNSVGKDNSLPSVKKEAPEDEDVVYDISLPSSNERGLLIPSALAVLADKSNQKIESNVDKEDYVMLPEARSSTQKYMQNERDDDIGLVHTDKTRNIEDITKSNTPPEILGDQIFAMEEDCREMIKVANEILATSTLESLKLLGVRHRECVDMVNNLKQQYISKHHIDVARYTQVFPVNLSTGEKKVVLLPPPRSAPTQVSNQSSLPHSRRDTSLYGRDDLLDDSNNWDTTEDDVGRRRNKIEVYNPAFISNEKFLEYFTQNPSTEASTLSKFANMLHM